MRNNNDSDDDDDDSNLNGTGWNNAHRNQRVEDVQQESHETQGHGQVVVFIPEGRELPSELEYKDQGRHLSSFVTPQPTEEGAVAIVQAEPIGTESPQATTTRRKKGIFLATFAVMAIASVLCGVLLSKNRRGKQDDVLPPFDGTTQAVIVLHNATKLMNGDQREWYQDILARFLESTLIAPDRPYNPGWSVVVVDRIVTTEGLATELTVTIPLENMNDSVNIPSARVVEVLIQKTLKENNATILSQLQNVSHPFILAFFRTVSGMSVYAPGTKVSDFEALEEATPPPTTSQVALASAQPPPVLADSSMLLAFSTLEELRSAVLAYAEDPQNPDSAVAKQYGYPIGAWCVPAYPTPLLGSTKHCEIADHMF